MSSLRERLQAQRERQLREKTLTRPLPGWVGPRVFIRYRPVQWERLLDLLTAAATSDSAKDALRSNVDALVAACDALLVQEDGDEAPVSLAQRLRDEGETVHGEVRFDAYAVDVLGLQYRDPEENVLREPKSAAETCLAAFAGAVSPELAVMEHAAQLGDWMRSASTEEDDALLGG